MYIGFGLRAAPVRRGLGATVLVMIRAETSALAVLNVEPVSILLGVVLLVVVALRLRLPAWSAVTAAMAAAFTTTASNRRGGGGTFSAT